MKIILKELTIKHFKGINELTVKFTPTKTEIFGANHTGKTTTADAIHWVLFGKSSDSLTAFGIDPKDEQNHIIHHLDNSVRLTLEADGVEMVLEKVRKETWKKVRGSAAETLSGHTTDHFVNGDHYTAQDYTARISQIVTEGLFRAITNPLYFPRLKAEEQRLLLLKMVGERTTAQIAKDKGLTAIADKIEGKEVKEYRQHLAYRMKEIKDALTALPNRIKENKEWCNTIQLPTVDQMHKELESIDEKLAQCDNLIKDASLKTDLNEDDKRKQRNEINRLKWQLSDIVNTAEETNRNNKKQYQSKLNACWSAINTLENKASVSQTDVETYQRSLNYIANDIEQFKKKWNMVEEEQFHWDDTQEICPCCGRRLETDRINQIKQQALDNWQQEHQRKQDELDTEAETLKAKQSKVQALIATAQATLKDTQQAMAKEQEQLALLQQEAPTPINAKETNQYIKAAEQLAQAEHTLDNMCKQSLNAQDNQQAAIRAEAEQNKKQLQAQRDDLRDKLSLKAEYDNRQRRIEELETQMQQLAQQLALLEEDDTEAEQLEHATIEDLQDRVNGLFSLVRFQMFDQKINGNVKATCTLTMHGVPYADLSNSEKINAGLDVINAMCRHNNTFAPIIIDNAESVNDILHSDSQQICLIVSRDEQLTIVNNFT